VFREFLKKDLIGIFEKSEVDFSNSLVEAGQEANCIFVVIDQDGVKNNFRTGENYFSVTGTLEFIQDSTETNFGYFNQRMALSKFQSEGKFILIGRESNEPLNSETERLLVKKSQKFSYRISIPYNLPIGEIEDLELQGFIN
jgi:hypothetical protein